MKPNVHLKFIFSNKMLLVNLLAAIFQGKKKKKSRAE